MRQLAGTRLFGIAAGATVNFNLVCDHIAPDPLFVATLKDSALTAIFTPTP